MVKKTRKNAAIRELEHQLNKAIQKGDDQLSSDLYVDIAEDHRRNGELRDAVEAYKNSLAYSEKCCAFENAAFAHRAIAEILIDPSIADNAKALLHGRKYFQAAGKSGQVHLVQLAYHVYGWVQFQVYLNSAEKDAKLLNESKDWCEKGLAYLNRNSVAIDSDPKAVRIGQNSRARKARLRQVLSQIYDKLGDSTQALYHHNAAFAYAVRDMDYDLQYRCLLSKLNFVGDQRLKTAVDLVHVASNLGPREHAESKFILAQEKIRARDFGGAKWDLVSMLSSKDVSVLEEDEQSFFQQCLVAVYKTLERLRKMSKLSLFDQMKTCEKIADEFIDLDFRETSLEFYKRMLAFAKEDRDKLKALVSIAETAKELGDFEEAFECYLKIEAIENRIDLDKRKKAETAVCMFAVATKVGTMSVSKVKDLFEKAEKVVVTDRQMRDLFEAYYDFLKGLDLEDGEIYNIKSKLVSLQESTDGVSETLSDHESSPDAWSDESDKLSDEDILILCEAEAKRRNLLERVMQEKDKKINLYGETRMHEAARGTDLKYLKQLIKAGYNLNARDEGGWTPLHEAIGALKLENVRALVESGARLDIRSNEGTLSAEGERTDSGGLTPLMEACDRGSTAIAALLLEHGANVALRNKDNWTALDFFRNAIQCGMVEDEDMPAADKLIDLMENKLRQANAPVSKVPPPRKILAANAPRKRLAISKENLPASTSLSPEKRNLLEYRKIMRNVGRGDVHERTCIDVMEPAHFAEEDERISVSSIASQDQYPDLLLYGDSTDLSPLKNLSPNLDLESVNDIVQSPNASGSRRKRKTRRVYFDRRVVQQNKKSRFIECPDSDSDGGVASNVEPCQTKSNYNEEKSRRSSSVSINFEQPTQPTVSPALSDHSTVASVSRLAIPIPETIPSSKNMSQSFGAVDISSQASAPQSLLFVKISFVKLDGGKIKIKGIPFNRTATISEVRKRCLEELKSEGEVSFISIRQGECELSDETPIFLVLDGTDNSLECVIGELSKRSPVQTYTLKAKVAKCNILRALGEAASGTLDLAASCIEKEGDAIKEALFAFPVGSLSEIRLSENVLSTKTLKAVAYLARMVSVLKLESCALNSSSIEVLLDDRSPCVRLSQLNLSYNDIGNLPAACALPSFLKLCPNIQVLNLSSCSLGEFLMPSLLNALKDLSVLEYLNISHNPSVTSYVANTVTSSSSKLAILNLSNTAFTGFAHSLDPVCQLDRLCVSGCDVNGNFLLEWLFSYGYNLSFLDLSYTLVCCSHLEGIMKQKGAKLPLLSIRLFGCMELEKDCQGFVELLGTYVTTDMTLRFELADEFRENVLSRMTPSFAFCII